MQGETRGVRVWCILLPWWKLWSATYPPILHTDTATVTDGHLPNGHLWFHGVDKTCRIIYQLGRDEPFLQEILPKAEVFFMDHLLPELISHSKDPHLTGEIRCLHCKRSNFGKMIKCTDCCQLLLCIGEHYQILKKMEMWMQIDPNKKWRKTLLQFCRQMKLNNLKAIKNVKYSRKQ